MEFKKLVYLGMQKNFPMGNSQKMIYLIIEEEKIKFEAVEIYFN